MAKGKKKEVLTLEERLQAALVPESEQPYQVPGNWCWKSGFTCDTRTINCCLLYWEYWKMWIFRSGRLDESTD